MDYCGVRMGLSTRAGGGGAALCSLQICVVIVEFAKIPSIRRGAKGGETGEDPTLKSVSPPYLGKKALKHIKLFPHSIEIKTPCLPLQCRTKEIITAITLLYFQSFFSITT